MTRADIEAATAAVGKALRERSDLVYDDLADAVRHVVQLRDRLISERRRGDPAGDRLAHVNSLLSLMVGAEYPLEGLHRERIQKVRDELASLLL